MNDFLKKEVKEKFEKHLDNSYILMSVGDLRELIPELNELIRTEKPKQLNPGPEPPKLVSSPKVIEEKIYGDDEILTIPELERRLIHLALLKTGGIVDKAAQELGISERNLYRKFITYGIDHESYRKKSKNSK